MSCFTDFLRYGLRGRIHVGLLSCCPHFLCSRVGSLKVVLQCAFTDLQAPAAKVRGEFRKAVTLSLCYTDVICQTTDCFSFVQITWPFFKFWKGSQLVL